MYTFIHVHHVKTLHSASLPGPAHHVRSQPVLLLDPADQLVLGLRTTIKDLRNENEVTIITQQ